MTIVRWNLEMQALCCGRWRAGGILNIEKLPGFKLRLEDGRLVYKRGIVYTAVGPIKYQQDSLQLVGVPRVMGEVPLDALKSTNPPDPLPSPACGLLVTAAWHTLSAL